MEQRTEGPVVRIESGVRRHARPTLAARWRRMLLRRRLGALGEDALIEGNVSFMRFPGNISLGDRVIVKEGCRLCPANAGARISIGDWTTVGYHTYMFSHAGISVGKNCLIAPFCYLVDNNHGIARDRLIREQPMTARPIVIEDDVWLGAHVTVLSGVRIGTGAVVGASSVVRQDVAPYAIVSGNPAQVVGERR